MESNAFYTHASALLEFNRGLIKDDDVKEKADGLWSFLKKNKFLTPKQIKMFYAIEKHMLDDASIKLIEEQRNAT